jgi:hypothetical protein
MQITKDRIIWDKDDFLAGLSPQYSDALTDVPMLQGNQLAHSKNLNPYRYLGYAAPGWNTADITNVSVVNSEIISGTTGAESGTNYGYLISNGAKLHRFDISANSLTNAGSWPHSIVGTATEEGNDIVTYSANIGGTRTKCIFYSWNDNGADLWNVGIYNLAAASFDDDWMSTVPATPLAATDISSDDLPRPMIVGADDTLIIGSGNLVHALDGATGTNSTFQSQRLVLPSGYIIKAFARMPNYLAIFAYYSPSGNSVNANTVSSGPATCFLWDYLSDDPTYVYDLDDYFVTAAVELKDGSVGCFTSGKEPMPDGLSRYSKYQVFNGSGFEVASYFIADPPGKGGCFVNGDAVYWLSEGVVNMYGPPYPGLPVGLNRIASGAGTTDRGMLKQFSTNKILACTGLTTSGGLQRFVTSEYASSASFTTQLAQPVFPPGQYGKVKSFTVYFADTASGGRTFSLFAQDTMNSTTQIISALQTVTASTMVVKYEESITPTELPTFDGLRMIGTWSAGSAGTDAPIIRRIEAEYYTVNIKRD